MRFIIFLKNIFNHLGIFTVYRRDLHRLSLNGKGALLILGPRLSENSALRARVM